MQIHQSAEDYLETILMLTQRMGRVRSIDVVNELGYTKASVSIAMKKLRENGYIAVDGRAPSEGEAFPQPRRRHGDGLLHSGNGNLIFSPAYNESKLPACA